MTRLDQHVTLGYAEWRADIAMFDRTDHSEIGNCSRQCGEWAPGK